jgi:hypothetical protein
MTLLPAILEIPCCRRGPGRFVGNFLYDEAAFQVVSECAVTREVLLILPRFFFYLVSVFRRALPIGESWSPGYSTSGWLTNVSRTRWTTSGSSMDPTQLSLPREGPQMPSWWQCTSGAACGSGSMGRWDPPSQLEGELVLFIGQSFISQFTGGISSSRVGRFVVFGFS